MKGVRYSNAEYYLKRNRLGVLFVISSFERSEGQCDVFVPEQVLMHWLAAVHN